MIAIGVAARDAFSGALADTLPGTSPDFVRSDS
jgi:hypothetical protein